MDRDANGDGRGKYALVRLRGLPPGPVTAASVAAAIVLDPSAVVLGRPGSEDEFFVVMLKDVNAGEALEAYARAAARNGDPEFSEAVARLAARAGRSSKFCKSPD